MDYLDFELEIGTGQGREYPVVVRSPAGEARGTLRFPFDTLELQNKLLALQLALANSRGLQRRVNSPQQQTVSDFGGALFDALLTGEVYARYTVSQERAKAQGKGLRLKVRFNAPDMAALPWEYLYDRRNAKYVCLSRETPLVRYLELSQSIQPLTVTPPLHILGMVASPHNLDALDVNLEKQRMDEALEDLQADGLVTLTWLNGDTWRHLQRALRRGEWHVFHFIGHGDFDTTADEGMVMFCGEDGKAQRMPAMKLGQVLANHASLRLVLLNACEGAQGSEYDLFSSTASTLVRAGLPAVLAMQYAISDAAAIEFARTFYESLADGLAIDAAVVEARVAVNLAAHNTVEWGTPVLHMRAPDGVLFQVQAAGDGNQESASQRESKQADQPPSSTTPGGLPPGVYARLQTALLACGMFDTDKELRAVFADGRIRAWRAQLPQAAHPAGRVQAVVDYLYDRFNTAGDNALFLLISVMQELTDAGDLALEVEAALQPPVVTQRSGSEPRADVDAPPSAQSSARGGTAAVRPSPVAAWEEARRKKQEAEEEEARRKKQEVEAAAQQEREEQARQAEAAQWQAETEQAIANGEWRVARLAVGRWLKVTPDNPAAQAARRQIEQQEAKRKEQEAEAARAARALAAQAVEQPGQFQAACAAVQRWLEMSPGNAEATTLLAQLAAQKQEVTRQAIDLAALAAEQPEQCQAARLAAQRWADIAPDDQAASNLLADLIAQEEEARRKKQKEADRKVQEEADRKAQEEADRKAQEKARRRTSAQAKAAQPDVMVWEKDGKEMVRVPAGEFLYGETPFWIDDKTPITNAEYARFIEATGHKPPEHWPKAGGLFSSKKKPPADKLTQPVADISRDDAMAYAQWAGKQFFAGAPLALQEFWIDKTPVTNAEYARFVEATGHEPPEHWLGGTSPADKLTHPVVNVSWHDAVAYAEWAGKRLPTEEEWEKAARGTDGRMYPWGNTPPNERLCNFNQNMEDTMPVGKYSPAGDSSYGCVDMAGNVWDWTASDWGATDKDKVVRGGSWYFNERVVRTADRDGLTPTYSLDGVGFRCVAVRQD